MDSPTINSSGLTSDQEKGIELALRLKASGKNMMLITGRGGCGKSYAVHKIIEKLAIPEYEVCWTATTHKACFSLESEGDTETPVVTVQSVLKMRVTSDQECRSLASAGQVDVDHLQVVIVDEVSYLPDGLVDRIMKVSSLFPHVFWIFMGDQKQLNPVRHSVSPIFDIVPKEQSIKFVISVRQREGSAVLSTVDEIRQAISDNYRGKVQFESEYSEYGSLIVLSGKDFYSKFISSCLDDDKTRGIAWKNSTVDRMNYMVREKLYGKQAIYEAPFMVSEKVIAGSTLRDSENDLVIANSRREGEIVDLAAVDYIPSLYSKYGIMVSGYEVTVDFKLIGQVYYPDREGWSVFLDKEKELYARAKKSNSPYQWRQYHEIREFIGDLRYQWALTAHTSQGSTLGNEVFIDADDMNECNKPEERLRLFNVALSRGIKDVYVKQRNS